MLTSCAKVTVNEEHTVFFKHFILAEDLFAARVHDVDSRIDQLQHVLVHRYMNHIQPPTWRCCVLERGCYSRIITPALGMGLALG